MDIRVEPEYDDLWSFSDLIRESKKYLIIFAYALKWRSRTLSAVEGCFPKKGFDYAQPTVAMMVSTRLSQQSHSDGFD
ncbi:hypothetical protein GCM10010995_17140 [Cysteiniphilum litorale]|uniref:Uncharacterized protein n=1 Tax=Cysteiniphilum litorale TaxID=2056700 RepID=A0A8J2Z4X4_9GAMM|nr:hypothetical protein GCM10010995_17140 [Cysteiniphilum litorale]